MTIFEPDDFTDPARFSHKAETAICPSPDCREAGAIVIGPASASDILVAQCERCGEVIELIPALDPNAFGAARQGSYMKATTERQLRENLRATLTADFEVFDEAWLRHHSGLKFKIDLLIVPKAELADRFPFKCVGIEIKREPVSVHHQTHALAQCVSYIESHVNDKRVPWLRSLPVPCVALYQGRTAEHSGELARFDGGSTMRFAGRLNIGEFVRENRHELSLLISHERIWSKRYGTTPAKAVWPATRPKGSR